MLRNVGFRFVREEDAMCAFLQGGFKLQETSVSGLGIPLGINDTYQR